MPVLSVCLSLPLNIMLHPVSRPQAIHPNQRRELGKGWEGAAESSQGWSRGVRQPLNQALRYVYSDGERNVGTGLVEGSRITVIVTTTAIVFSANILLLSHEER